MNLITIASWKNTVIFVIVLSSITLLVILRVYYIKQQRRLLITNYYDKNEDNNTIDQYLDSQYKEKMQVVGYIMNAKHRINLINERQTVHNMQYLGPVKKSIPILVIQVHANPFYLRVMLDSLKMVMGITKSLLIFSHDYFDYEINRLIKDIKFAKYMQIFYPYSVQMHPKVFPGNDTRYCSEWFNCMVNGNRRNAVLAQSKLFWWWLLNKVFDRLDVTAEYDGNIVFLEEDNIVTEDLIYVLKLLERIQPEDCPQCGIYSLGAHSASFEHYHVQNGIAVVEGWSSKVNSVGLAFNRTIWRVIKNYSYDYCYFNDFSWDNSMRYVGTKKTDGRFLMLNVEGPRVFKIEKCSNESYTMDCNMNYMVKKVQRYVKFIRKGLYPRNIVTRYNGEEFTHVKESGFFSDVRDRELCMYFGFDK